MKRDAVATRERILAAAVDEFARNGLAGARINRIAELAKANKSLLYQYFGNKDALFDAAFEAVVVQTVSEVPLDPTDLAEYAAQLFDWHRAHPAPLRVAAWDRLERDGLGGTSSPLREAIRDKVDAVAAAQAAGRITDRFSARSLLELVIAISQSGPVDLTQPVSVEEAAEHREAIRLAVATLVAPTPS